jgi:DNA-directed RNA polymerase specialized sigma24 family protein
MRQAIADPRAVEEVVALREALAALTRKQRQAILLTVVLGLSQREAGALLGVTQQAIEDRMRRGQTL